VSEFDNIPQMFFERARRYGASTRYWTKSDGRYVATSWDTCRQHVEEIAAGLLELGIRERERVAILAGTRPEWTEADLAALAVGCVTVPIYPSNLPAECGYIMFDSGARSIFCENVEQARKIRTAVETGVEVDGTRHTVAVDHIILIDGRAEGCLTLDELRARGRSRLDAHRVTIEHRTRAIHAEELATIVYTSGTTGLPKGVLQSHGNHLSSLRAVGQLGIVSPGEIDYSFLPLAHSFGRMMEYMGIFLATETAYAEKIETLSADLQLCRPHFLPSVPRIYEKIYSAVQQARAANSEIARRIFDAAIWIGKQRAYYVNEGTPVPAYIAALDAIAHRLVFEKIHARVGGRMRYLISGGAPLAKEINEFFHAVGLPVLEGYGLTETTPILTCNRPGKTRIGTVGVPIDGVTLAIASDGEILAKGPNVAYGYHDKPEETAEAWDRDGWFHTGDVGEIEGGFLSITDRKKELIKTAGGKYVAPQKIENLLKSRPLISQAMVVGDRMKYCVALITLDEQALQALDSEPAKAAGDDRLRSAVQKEIDEVNRNLASFETIKKFAILPRDFSIEGGELTPSLKIKRKVIERKYAGEIAAMADS
jgi:long-chain acyl-CoA synthetase